MNKPEKLVVTAGLALTVGSFAYLGAEQVYDDHGYLSTAEALERCVGDVAISSGTVEGCDLDGLESELKGTSGASITWKVDGEYVIGTQPVIFRQEDIDARIGTLRDKDSQYGPHVGKAAAALAGFLTISMSLWGHHAHRGAKSLWNGEWILEKQTEDKPESKPAIEVESDDAVVLKLEPSQNTQQLTSAESTPATVTGLTGTIT